jgi:hypothetical protein
MTVTPPIISLKIENFIIPPFIFSPPSNTAEPQKQQPCHAVISSVLSTVTAGQVNEASKFYNKRGILGEFDRFSTKCGTWIDGEKHCLQDD